MSQYESLCVEFTVSRIIVNIQCIHSGSDVFCYVFRSVTAQVMLLVVYLHIELTIYAAGPLYIERYTAARPTFRRDKYQ